MPTIVRALPGTPKPKKLSAREKAIRASVCKWERMCASLTGMWEAGVDCTLCEYRAWLSGVKREAFVAYGPKRQRRQCNKYCPLGQAKHGCLDEGSEWHQIDEFLNEYNRPHFLSGLEEPRDMNIIDLYEAIYVYLCDLLPDYDPNLDPEALRYRYI